MREYLALMTLILGLLAQAASAQVTTLPVRGGEHADFTRIVVRIPEENHWSVTSDERQVRLDVTGPPLRFDLTQTFSKIPRTRLRDAKAGPDWLELHLACDCDIVAAEEIRGFLVIDIFGTPSIARPASLARSRPRPRPENFDRPPTDSSVAAYRAGLELARLARDGASDQTARPSLTLQTLFDDPAGHAAFPPAPPPETETTDRAAITQELARALSSSVAEGILHSDQAFDPGTISAPPDSGDMSAQLGAHVSIPTGSRISGQIDSDTLGRETAQCLAAEGIDMSLWRSDAAEKSTEFLWQDLYGEFDRLDLAKVITLAQHFLLQGFGAEARMVLRMLSDSTLETQLLERLGHLVDLEMRPPLPELQSLKDCSAFAHLWAFLDKPREEPLYELRPDLLYKAVTQLPPDLRLHLGPEIIQRLTQHGERDLAQTIREAVDRSSAEATPALELARVALDLPQSPPSQSAQIEARLAPEHSDDALLFLLEQREKQDIPLETALLIQAEDRLLALRNTPEGRRIARLLIGALFRVDDFAAAVTVFEQQKPHLGPDMITAMTDVLEGLVVQADDQNFVTLVFRLAPWAVDGLPSQTRDRVADRLDNLAFAAQARLLRETDPADREAPPEVASRPERGQENQSLQTAGQSSTVADGANVIPSSTNEISTTQTEAMSPLDTTGDSDVVATAPAHSTALDQSTDASAEDFGLMQQEVALQSTGPDQVADLQSADMDANATPDALDAEGFGPRSQPSPFQEQGLLGQGRAALSESGALRERVRALLASQDIP